MWLSSNDCLSHLKFPEVKKISDFTDGCFESIYKMNPPVSFKLKMTK